MSATVDPGATSETGDRKQPATYSWPPFIRGDEGQRRGNSCMAGWITKPALGFTAYGYLAESVEAVIADGGVGDTAIEQRVHQGDARVALRGIEADAAMLVLGARGHSGIAELVFGSVTSSLIHKPECPVVVIPQPKDED